MPVPQPATGSEWDHEASSTARLSASVSALHEAATAWSRCRDMRNSGPLGPRRLATPAALKGPGSRTVWEVFKFNQLEVFFFLERIFIDRNSPKDTAS